MPLQNFFSPCIREKILIHISIEIDQTRIGASVSHRTSLTYEVRVGLDQGIINPVVTSQSD